MRVSHYLLMSLETGTSPLESYLATSSKAEYVPTLGISLSLLGRQPGDTHKCVRMFPVALFVNRSDIFIKWNTTCESEELEVNDPDLKF